jgi:hypothetical protein
MERITNKDIDITHHMADGFTLSCMYNGFYYHQRYIGRPVKDAKKRFKAYVYKAAGACFNDNSC